MVHHFQEDEIAAFLGEERSLVRREYPTGIGPVDLLWRDADGHTVAIEVKREAELAANGVGAGIVAGRQALFEPVRLGVGQKL